MKHFDKQPIGVFIKASKATEALEVEIRKITRSNVAHFQDMINVNIEEFGFSSVFPQVLL